MLLRREESEGVQNGSVKGVTQMGSPVVEWALPSGGGLDAKSQEGNHGKTSMLDLCELKPGFLLRPSTQTYLSGVLPSNAGEPLDGQGTESSQHGPPAMNELTFPEPLDPEHLTVRLKRSRLNVGALYPGPNDVSGHILGQVLVQRVQLKLQVLSGLCQPERVKPNVTHQASVQPFRRLRSGEPRRPSSATFATMGRMHSRSKGISSSALPYKRTPPSWLKISSGDVEDNICKFTKRDMTPSQIGVILRDSHGIAQVKSVIGSKILRILKAHGFAPEIPEDLYHLIKKVVAIRKHLERNRKDKDSKFRLF
nr:40S ribosomal protein S13 [Ipomoea batatas]